jgi:hypothetical protein
MIKVIERGKEAWDDGVQCHAEELAKEQAEAVAFLETGGMRGTTAESRKE